MSFFTSPLVLNSSSLNGKSQPSGLSFTTQSFLIPQLRPQITIFNAQNLVLQNLNNSSVQELPLTKKVKPQEPKTTTNVILQSSAESLSTESPAKNTSNLWKSPANKDSSEPRQTPTQQVGFTPRTVEQTKMPVHSYAPNAQMKNLNFEQQLMAMQNIYSLVEHARRLKEQQELSQMMAKTAAVFHLQNSEGYGSPLSKASTDSRTVQSPLQNESSESHKFSKDIKSNQKSKMEDFDSKPLKSETKKGTTKKSKQSARSNESRITRKRLQKQIEKLETVTAFLTQPIEPKENGRRMNSLQAMKTHQDEEQHQLLEEVTQSDISQYLKCNGNSSTRVGSDFQALIPTSTSPRPKRELKCSWNPDVTEESYSKNFVDQIENIIGYKHLSDEKAMKLLIRYNMDASKALESVSKNKTYYKNLLSAECKKYVKELKKIN